MQQTTMQQTSAPSPTSFVERRYSTKSDSNDSASRERRQFVNSHQSLRPGVQELAEAIDQYKLRHRRRFITFEELYDVVVSLGYRK